MGENGTRTPRVGENGRGLRVGENGLPPLGLRDSLPEW